MTTLKSVPIVALGVALMLLFLGSQGFAGGLASVDVDLDSDGQDETCTPDPEHTPNQTGPINPGGDTPIGTHSQDGQSPDGDIIGADDMDGDGEDEVVVTDPGLASFQSYGVDLDGDGDYDIWVVGTYVDEGEPAAEAVILDVEGDGDADVVVDNPNKTPEQSGPSKDVDGDGDTDIYEAGSSGAQSLPDPEENTTMEGDLDGDPSESETVIFDDASSGDTDYDVDGDGDWDVRVSGTQP